jgi:glycerol kinase
MGFILSIDQGTSSTRSIIFDENGKIRGNSQKEHNQYYPHEAWVEHDPEGIKQAVLQTMRDSLKQAKLDWKSIDSIGITNQRETIVAWEKDSGKPLAKAIVWQCRRTTDIVDRLKQDGHEKLFHEKTGLILDAYFSGTKMNWLLSNNESVSEAQKQGRLSFGTIDSWIIHFLSKEHRTDASNASRTLLYDLQRKEWSDDLCEILSIDKSTLPLVTENASDVPFGYYNIDGQSIPIRGVLGDQQAALFGQAGFQRGNIKTTYGTGNFTLMNTGEVPKFSSNGLLTTVAWEFDKKTNYALEGSVFITGAALQWLRDNLEIFNTYDQIDSIVDQSTDSAGVIFVPAFVGLGAPYWDATARGLIILTALHSRLKNYYGL